MRPASRTSPYGNTRQAREMSRRVRGYLIRYGIVEAGDEAMLRHGAAASRGDLIVARRNEHSIIAGEPGRWLTNRDVLSVEAVGRRTVTVRRLLGRDQGSGQPAWTEPFELPRTYLFSDCDLAYATTPHAVQGRTVDTTHVLVDGLGTRQWLYVAMSRGREANYACCVTGFPRLADVREGSRPAAELRRVRRLMSERAGLGPEPDGSGSARTCSGSSMTGWNRSSIAATVAALRRRCRRRGSLPPLDPPECFAGGEVVAAARCPVDVSTYLRRHVVVVKHAGERHTFSVHEVAHDHVEWVGGQGHYDLSCPMRSAAWPRRRRSGHKPARPEGAWPGCSTAETGNTAKALALRDGAARLAGCRLCRVAGIWRASA
jgi:hypothetical protein